MGEVTVAVRATVLRWTASACMVAVTVWMVHGPILSTDADGEHGNVPHSWSVSAPADDRVDAPAGAHQECHADRDAGGGHGHTSVFVPADVTDTHATVTTNAAPDHQLTPVAAVSRTGGGAPRDGPARPPSIRALSCVSRT
jgi:hypothetical protein